MKKILLLTLLTACSASSVHAFAYADSFYLIAYKNGDPEWDQKNQEWLDSDEDEPYPDDLKDIEGDGYRDSQRAAEEAGILESKEPILDS